MRLKLDENLRHDLADALTRLGHGVDTVLDEQLGGRKDPVVVQAATDVERMVITLDRGVGDIRSFTPGSHAGVVVLRPVSQDPVSIVELVDRVLDTHELEEFSRCILARLASGDRQPEHLQVLPAPHRRPTRRTHRWPPRLLVHPC